ncbi:MAG: O-antigen ligase family protein [bacterium]|nr:O-antigen ligase family protein [Candidatus Sumerlaeota bacterium]
MHIIGRKFFYLLLLLTVALIPIVLIPRIPTMNPAIHSKELASRFLLAGMGFMVILLWRWQPRRRLDLPQIALLSIVAVNLMATFASQRAGYSFFGFWHLWGFTLLALAIYRYAPSMNECRKFIIVIIGAAAIVAIYGMSAYFGFNPLRTFYPFVFKTEEGRNYIHSFLGNPEYFGGYMAPVAALAFSRFFRSGARAWQRLLWLIAVLFFLIALMLSGTRGATIGFAVAAVILLVREFPALPRRTRKWLGASLIALACATLAAIMVFSFPNPLNRRNVRIAQRFADLFDVTTASVRERILFFSVAGRMIAANPLLGVGPGGFRLEFYPTVASLVQADSRAGVEMMAIDLQNRVAEHAHNDYLEIWCQTGTLGLAAFLFLISVGTAQFITTRRPALAGADDTGTHAKDHAPGPPGSDPTDPPAPNKPLAQMNAGDAATSCITQKMSELELCRTGFFAAAACIFINAAFSFPFHLPERASLAWTLVGFFFASNRALREMME